MARWFSDLKIFKRSSHCRKVKMPDKNLIKRLLLQGHRRKNWKVRKFTLRDNPAYMHYYDPTKVSTGNYRPTRRKSIFFFFSVAIILFSPTDWTQSSSLFIRAMTLWAPFISAAPWSQLWSVCLMVSCHRIHMPRVFLPQEIQ